MAFIWFASKAKYLRWSNNNKLRGAFIRSLHSIIAPTTIERMKKEVRCWTGSHTSFFIHYIYPFRSIRWSGKEAKGRGLRGERVWIYSNKDFPFPTLHVRKTIHKTAAPNFSKTGRYYWSNSSEERKISSEKTKNHSEKIKISSALFETLHNLLIHQAPSQVCGYAFSSFTLSLCLLDLEEGVRLCAVWECTLPHR